MKLAFNIDSKLWKFFDYAGDLVILNLLFVLTSLPVITIGASITAMDAVLFKRKEKRTDDIKKEYFREWKANFKNSTVIWLFLLSFIIFCAMNFQIAVHASAENRMKIFLIIGTALPAIVMTALYSFAMLARFENDLATTVSKAFFIGIMSLPYTVVILLILTASVLASIQTYATMLTAASVWLLIGFSGIGFLCCEMYYRAFRRFTREEDLPGDTLDAEMYACREQYRRQKKEGKRAQG